MLYIVEILGIHSQDEQFPIKPQNTHHVIGQVKPLYFNISRPQSNDVVTWTVHITDQEVTVALSNTGVLQQFENDYALEDANLIVKNADFGDATYYKVVNLIAPNLRFTAEAIIIGKFRATNTHNSFSLDDIRGKITISKK